jgi:hypothetical protein
MARFPRLCLPDIPQHIIQRGINRQPCFAAEEDFSAFVLWLEAMVKACQRLFKAQIETLSGR